MTKFLLAQAETDWAAYLWSLWEAPAWTTQPLEERAYGQNHLAEHLEDAGMPDRMLYSLVGERWLRAWAELDDTYAGFVLDVQRAWRHAEQRGESPPGLHPTGETIAVQIKCALCVTSITSVSQNVDPELLALCVENEVITPGSALSTIRGILPEDQRLRALAQLLPQLPSASLLEAKALAHEFTDPEFRSRALGAVATRLPSDLQAPEFRQALRVLAEAQLPDDYALVRVFSELAARLPTALHEEALSVVEHISTSDYRKGEALDSLLPYLHDQSVCKVQGIGAQMNNTEIRLWFLTDVAQRFPTHTNPEMLRGLLADAEALDGGRRVSAQSAIVALLPEPERTELLTKLLSGITALPEADRRDPLTRIAPFLPTSLLREALDILNTCESEYWRGEALSKFAPHLPPGLLAEAVNRVWAMSDKNEFGQYPKANTLVRLVPYCPPESIPQILMAVRHVDEPHERSQLMSDLAAYLPAELAAREAHIAANDCANVVDRVNLLTAFIPHLPPNLGSGTSAEVLATVRTIEDSQTRVFCLSKILPHLTKHMFPSALEILSTTKVDSERGRGIRMVAERAPAEHMEGLLAIARKIDNRTERVEALAGLVPQLTPELRKTVLLEALAAARRIPINDTKQHTLVTESLKNETGGDKQLPVPPKPDLKSVGNNERENDEPGPEVSRAREKELCSSLAAAAQLDEPQRASALVRIGPHLNPTLALKAVEIAGTIADSELWCDTIIQLSPYLPDSCVDAFRNAFWIVRELYAPHDKLSALTCLIPRLPLGVYSLACDEALETARSLHADVRIKAHALAELAPVLPPALRSEAQKEAIDTAAMAPHEDDRARIFNELAPTLSFGLLPQLLEAALAMGKGASTHTAQIVSALAGMAPRLVEWDGQAPSEAYLNWKMCLHAIAANPRPQFLECLNAVLPFALALAGSDATREVASAISACVEEVTAWWP